MILSAVQDMKDPDVMATLAQFRARTKLERTMLSLLDVLDELAVDHDEAKAGKAKLATTAKDRKKQGKGGGGGGQGGGQQGQGGNCKYCGKPGHVWNECRTLAAHKKEGNVKWPGGSTGLFG